ncbi:DNA-directed RNA polymerase III subunit rpc25 [Terramyces sp. JEL0728]|nr:DNA-directed RNA polymerase III subunit rpc25 [Terramyces sp. JEL0728]
MFVLETIEDLVRVQPASFKYSQIKALEDELNRKYSNKVLHNVGLCLRVYDIDSATDPIIHACQDGSYQFVFRMVVFRPFKGQVLLGLVKDCDAVKGVRVSLKFFDDIYIPPQYLMDGTVFNREEGAWVWKYDDNEYFMDPGNWIRFRVEQAEFIDVGPMKKSDTDETLVNRKAPYTIYASCAEQGLGLIDWW